MKAVALIVAAVVLAAVLIGPAVLDLFAAVMTALDGAA